MRRNICLDNPVETAHPLNAGLVAWWLGLRNNSGGGTLFDLCGKYHAARTNAPPWTVDRGGFGCLDFNGTNQHASAALDMSAYYTMTVSCWLNLDVVADTGRYHFAFASGIRLYHIANAGQGLKIGWGTSSYGYTSYAMTAGVWYHVAAAVDVAQSTGAAELRGVWINGIASGFTSQVAANSTGTLANGTVYLGSSDGGTQYSNGRVADIRIHNRVLDSSTVYALYEQSLRGHPDTLRRYSTAAWFVPEAAGGSAEGTLSATLAAPTLTAAGTVAVVGTLSPTLAAPTLSAAGTVAVVGTLSATLAAPTLTAAGTAGSVGTATITLATPSSTAAGTVAVVGAAAPTLAAPTPTAAGTVAVAGAAMPTLTVPTPTAAGTVSLSGSAVVTLDLPALAAAGAVAVTAELAAALAGYTLTAAGTVAESSGLVATLAVTLDGPTLLAVAGGRRRAFDPAGDMALFDADRTQIDPGSDMDYFD